MSRQPKINEKVWVKSICQDKPCTVKEINWIYVKVKPFRKEAEEVLIDEIEFIEPETFSGEEKKSIILRLVKQEILKESSNYYREVATLNNLIKKYPNLNFWRQFNAGFQVRSLMWFLGKGASQMNNFYNQFELDFKTKKIIIPQQEKIGKDESLKNKQTVMDLLNKQE